MKPKPDKHLKTTNYHFDITGTEISRVGKHCIISKFVPYEDFGGGPGWKCLSILFVLHYLGPISGWLLIHFEKQIEALFTIRQKFQRAK